jgi:GT2 family glycosyltransferase
MNEVAVVILNFNGKRFLQEFLPLVVAHSGGAKIVVADNGSTDGSADFVSNVFPTVQLVRMETNRGFCGGYNFALKKVEAAYYVLLNSDVEVTPNWIEPVIALFRSNSMIAAIQPKILSQKHKDEFEYAGAAGGLIDTLGYPFCRGRIFEKIEKDNQQYNDVAPIFWATGACHFVRASLYHQLGGLDEDYFAHMEEIDFCWRLKRAGYQIYYQGKSTVYHVGGGTLSSASPQKTYLNFRNGLSLILKHFSSAELMWKLPLRLILDWAAALKFLLQPSPQDALAVMRAHVTFFSSLRGELVKRRKLAGQLKNFKVGSVYPRWLVVDHYLLGKDKFEELNF